jgi:hypothetical protein
VWREQLGGPQAGIGWGITEERAADGWRQRFENSQVFWLDPPGGMAYLLYHDGTWEAVSVGGP